METITINDEFNKIKTQFSFHNKRNQDDEQTVDITVDTPVTTETFVHYVNDDNVCEDSTDRLEMVLDTLKRTFRFYSNKFFETSEVTAVLSITEYELDLFGVETYNGWDYDELMELEDVTYDEAVMKILLYCISVIQLELHMRQ